MKPITPETNLVLIGMPGAGKSTVGVLLAKVTSRNFLDTDVLIQSREGRRLQEILDRDGRAAFCAMEERHLLGLDVAGHVLATGGSAVYSEAALCHLRERGVTIHLDLPLAALERRLANFVSRGVVREPGQTLRSLFEERQPLYRRYADLTIATEGWTHEQVVEQILLGLGEAR